LEQGRNKSLQLNYRNEPGKGEHLQATMLVVEIPDYKKVLNEFGRNAGVCLPFFILVFFISGVFYF